MYTIIIEKSQPVMQVVAVFKNKSEQLVRDIANNLYADSLVDDYDVVSFPSENEMNEYLMSFLFI